MSRKPKTINLYDGIGECKTEDYDDGDKTFCVIVDCFALYDSKDVRQLQKWLIKAEKWLVNKEKYK